MKAKLSRGFKSFLEASGSPYQDIINDSHRLSIGILEVKNNLEKISELKDNKDIKKAIERLIELDVEVEFITRQLEALD